VRAEFDEILQSLTFEAGQMKWRLPAGWSESEGGAMFRLATLRSPQGVEIFVTSLTPGQNVLDNVNRWQDQLGLPPVTADNLPVERVRVNDLDVILYDASGPAAGGAAGTTRGPAAVEGASPAGQAGAAATADPREDSPWIFPPLDSQWQALPPSMVAVARWEKQATSGSMKLEVFQFPAEASFLSMIAIWVERVGLDVPTETQLSAATTSLKVADLAGEVFYWPDDLKAAVQQREAEDPSEETGAEPAQALIIARVERAEHAWYFKLEGDRPAVEAFAPDFAGFLQSLQLR